MPGVGASAVMPVIEQMSGNQQQTSRHREQRLHAMVPAPVSGRPPRQNQKKPRTQQQDDFPVIVAPADCKPDRRQDKHYEDRMDPLVNGLRYGPERQKRDDYRNQKAVDGTDR